MLIIRDTTGITVKRCIQDSNHVRIGVLQSGYWIDGVQRNIGKIEKPHNEFTINELEDMLENLERMARLCH